MRWAQLALFALCFVSAAAAEGPPPDVPPGLARIEGVVLRAETGAPVAGAEVALYALTSEGVPGLRRTTSDAEGRFAFENVANDPAIGWLVGARFEGVAFPGGRITFAPGEDVATVEVRVDQPTQDPSAVHVGELAVRLVRQPGGLRAIESLALRNDGRRTYYVPEAGRAESQPAFETALPARAEEFEMPLGVVPEGLVRSGGRLRWYGPVLPGAQELSWSYRLPPESNPGPEAPERFAFSLGVPAGAERVAVLLADRDATLEGDGLAGPEDAEVDGRSVRRWTVDSPRSGLLALRVSLPPARLSDGAVSVSEVRAVVELDDAALDVSESHLLRIEGDAHVLGTADAPLLRIPLPEGAARLRFGSDAPGIELAPHPEGGLAVLGTVAPGEARVDVGFQLAATEPPARLARSFAARTPVLSIFVPDNGRLAPESNRLHRRRPFRENDRTYLHFEAFEVAPGEEVRLELGALPPRARGSAAVALGLILVGGTAAGWLMLAPLRAQRGARATAAPAQEEHSAARREREALYEAIRDLDHDFETGKVTAEDHVRLRDELRGRAAALLAEERAASPDPPGARRAQPAGGDQRSGLACTRCGAPADSAHRFCAQCGAALPGAA
jgi:hypothetical protein